MSPLCFETISSLVFCIWGCQNTSLIDSSWHQRKESLCLPLRSLHLILISWAPQGWRSITPALFSTWPCPCFPLCHPPRFSHFESEEFLARCAERKQRKIPEPPFLALCEIVADKNLNITHKKTKTKHLIILGIIHFVLMNKIILG